MQKVWFLAPQGVHFSDPIFSKKSPLLGGQAAALWRLSNFLHRRSASGGAEVVSINIDETCVQYYQNEKAGYMTVESRRRKRTPRGLCRNVSQGAQRTNLTHLACITHDAALQRLLPQLLVVSESVMSVDAARRVRAILPPPFVLVVQPKGWVNNDTMVRFVHELSAALRFQRATRRFVVYMDAYRAHLSPRTLDAFGRADLCVAVIPANLTWALQPCDTHLFAVYKRTMATMGQVSLLRDATGSLNWERTISLVRDVSVSVLHERCWRRAFEDVGLCGDQRLVSKSTKEKLGFDSELPVVSSELPTLHQLQAIFPTGAVIDFHRLFSA